VLAYDEFSGAEDSAMKKAFLSAMAALLLVMCMVPLSTAADKSVDEFLAAPVAGRRALIKFSLDERQAAVNNLRVASITRNYNVEVMNGTEGPPIPGKDNGRFIGELLLLNGDFRSSIQWYMPDDKDRPTMNVKTTMNRSQGIARSIAEHGKLKGVYGAIDTKEDTFLQNVRFFYWFGAAFEDSSEFIYSQLVKHVDKLEVDDAAATADAIKVILELPGSAGLFLDRREVLLSPARGFLPVRIQREHLRRKSTTSEWFQDYRLVEEVTESRPVDGIWFPWRTRIIATTSRSRSDGVGTVHETSVSNLEIGRLKSADLAVEFPNGTEVHDRIRGEWFQVGAPPPGTTPSAPPRNTGLLIGVNVTVVGLIVLVFALLRRPRPKTS
jgi:hypothetical protein